MKYSIIFILTLFCFNCAYAQTSFAYNKVEHMPQFPGGDKAMYKFISENMNYPVAAQARHIKGTVQVRFIVHVDGSLSDITMLTTLGGGCMEEAARLISIMPKWVPGTHDGQKVNVYTVVPVRFH